MHIFLSKKNTGYVTLVWLDMLLFTVMMTFVYDHVPNIIFFIKKGDQRINNTLEFCLPLV